MGYQREKEPFDFWGQTETPFLWSKKAPSTTIQHIGPKGPAGISRREMTEGSFGIGAVSNDEAITCQISAFYKPFFCLIVAYWPFPVPHRGLMHFLGPIVAECSLPVPSCGLMPHAHLTSIPLPLPANTLMFT